MKSMKKRLGIMLSVMLAMGSLQSPVYAVDMDSTAVEAEIAAEELEDEEPEFTDASEDDEPENTSGDESVKEAASDERSRMRKLRTMVGPRQKRLPTRMSPMTVFQRKQYMNPK